MTLDGSASFDPDADTLYFHWTASVPLSDAHTPRPSGRFPLGDHSVQLSVTDGTGAGGTINLTVSVQDTTPPTISPASYDPSCLWPPNHKLVVYALGSNVQFRPTDACDPTPSMRIASVTSNEAQSAPGSGSTAPDYLFGDTGFCLRSERTGGGAGRRYDIVLVATDAAGNSSISSSSVAVPHNKGNCPTLPSSTFVEDSSDQCSFPSP